MRSHGVEEPEDDGSDVRGCQSKDMHVAYRY